MWALDTEVNKQNSKMSHMTKADAQAFIEQAQKVLLWSFWKFLIF